MDNPSLVDDEGDRQLQLLLCQAGDAILRARDQEVSQYGISVMRAAILFFIKKIGYRATPTEISRWMLRQPHGVSVTLSRMEKDGLVERVKDLDRKNLVRISITEKGHQVYRELVKLESIHRIMSSLSEEERRQLRSSLLKLRDIALEEIRVPKPPYPRT